MEDTTGVNGLRGVPLYTLIHGFCFSKLFRCIGSGSCGLYYSFSIFSTPFQEEEELIAEWQPEPLVPDVYPKDREDDPSPIVTG